MKAYSKNSKSGFTLLEVLVVVIIIGILAALAYSSLMELIFTNRAKETAQTIRTFTERALAESKRENANIIIMLEEGNIVARYPKNNNQEALRQPLSTGFGIATDISSPDPRANNPFGDGDTAKPSIGISGMPPGYFAACNQRGYCGGAVKTSAENYLRAYIKRPNTDKWEAL